MGCDAPTEVKGASDVGVAEPDLSVLDGDVDDPDSVGVPADVWVEAPDLPLFAFCLFFNVSLQ